MIRIHELLTAGKFPNCSSLGREFEVSSKTIQRDFEFMRDQLALPIEYDGPRHGYFYAHAVAQFPMITVSEGELVALLVAQKAVEQYRGTSFEKPLHAAFEKLVASLGNEASVSLHELSEAVSFRSAGVPKSQIEVFELLAETVMASRTVEFDYLSLRAKTSERRRVEPYHLACISNQWYLIANDLARNSLRTFSLTRIEKARDLKISFERPADFSAAKMLAGSFSAFEAGKTEVVRIRFDDFAARLVAERQWHKSQKLRQLDGGGAELTMQVGVAPDLEAWILGWGGHAEVLEPEALREKMANEVLAMVEAYVQGGTYEGKQRTGGPRSLGAGADDEMKTSRLKRAAPRTRETAPLQGTSNCEGGTGEIGGPRSLGAGVDDEKKATRLKRAAPGTRETAPLQGTSNCEGSAGEIGGPRSLGAGVGDEMKTSRLKRAAPGTRGTAPLQGTSNCEGSAGEIGGPRSLGAGVGDETQAGTANSLEVNATRPGKDRQRPAHHVPLERHNQAVILLVTVCTKDRKPILASQAALDLLIEAWRRADAWHVGRYVLMPDHLHLFCSPAKMPALPVKQWVRFWKADVSRHWPRSEEQPIWQKDFWDRQLRSANHYSERWNYVRENPVRAGICADAEKWPWQGEIHELRW